MSTVMPDKSLLRLGYFEDFSDPTFIFFGNGHALEYLRNALLSLPYRKCIDFSADASFAAVGGESLMLYLTGLDEGLRKAVDHQPDRFEWRLSVSQAQHFADQINAVIAAPQPCHDYLETQALGEIIVVVSKDEYPNGWPLQ